MAERLDEGVRAALTWDKDFHPGIHRAQTDKGVYYAFADGTLVLDGVQLSFVPGRAWEDTEAAGQADYERRAALSTPVPVIPIEAGEGLPRGSASGAEGEPVAWFYEFLGHNDQWIADVRLAKPKAPSGGAIRNVRPLSFASDLPSPLPSQVEPVAWPKPVVTNPDIPRSTGIPYLDCLLHRLLDAQQDVNLAANETMSQSLADASAVMDEVERALHIAAAALAAAEARADRAEEDERDRLFEHTMSSNKTKVFNWLRQQGAMLPADRAALRARNILKETPHGER